MVKFEQIPLSCKTIFDLTENIKKLINTFSDKTKCMAITLKDEKIEEILEDGYELSKQDIPNLEIVNRMLDNIEMKRLLEEAKMGLDPKQLTTELRPEKKDMFKKTIKFISQCENKNYPAQIIELLESSTFSNEDEELTSNDLSTQSTTHAAKIQTLR